MSVHKSEGVRSSVYLRKQLALNSMHTSPDKSAFRKSISTIASQAQHQMSGTNMRASQLGLAGSQLSSPNTSVPSLTLASKAAGLNYRRLSVNT